MGYGIWEGGGRGNSAPRGKGKVGRENIKVGKY
jgi:hypothetical protein